MKPFRGVATYGLLFILGLGIPPECLDFLNEILSEPPGPVPVGESRVESAPPDVAGDVILYFSGNITDTCSGNLAQDGEFVGTFWECSRLGEGSGQGMINDSGGQLSAEITLVPHGVNVPGALSDFDFVVSLEGEVSGDGKSIAGTWDSAPVFSAGGEFLGFKRAELSGLQVAWGDATCSQGVGLDSVLDTLRHLAGLPVEYDNLPCPFLGVGVAAQGYPALAWGDVDCSGGVDGRDALGILLDVAGQEQAAAQCPGIGDTLTLD